MAWHVLNDKKSVVSLCLFSSRCSNSKRNRCNWYSGPDHVGALDPRQRPNHWLQGHREAQKWSGTRFYQECGTWWVALDTPQNTLKSIEQYKEMYSNNYLGNLQFKKKKKFFLLFVIRSDRDENNRSGADSRVCNQCLCHRPWRRYHTSGAESDCKVWVNYISALSGQ